MYNCRKEIRLKCKKEDILNNEVRRKSVFDQFAITILPVVNN